MIRKHAHRNINVESFDNLYTGLEITGTYFNEAVAYDLDRESTINYLDAAGVVTMKDGMCLTDNGWISYEDWRNEYELTDEDVKDVIMLIKSAEEMKATTNRIMNSNKAA